MFHPIQAKITDEKKNVKEKNAEKKKSTGIQKGIQWK